MILNLIVRAKDLEILAHSERVGSDGPFLRRCDHKSLGFTISVKKGNAIFIVISRSYM